MSRNRIAEPPPTSSRILEQPTLDRRQGGLGHNVLNTTQRCLIAESKRAQWLAAGGARKQQVGSSSGRPRVVVVWHKQGDLRLHDHEPASLAHLCGATLGLPVLHVHVFDRFWFGRTRVAGFPKTGVLRAQFWRECAEDLRASLRARGQDLQIYSGMSSAHAFCEIMKQFDIERIFTYAEVCSEELNLEAEVSRAVQRNSAQRFDNDDPLARSWGYTLHHIEDLPSTNRGPPEKWITPGLSFGQFKSEVKASRIRQVGSEWEQRTLSKGVPMCPKPEIPQGGTFWRSLPSLKELGFQQVDEDAVAASLIDQRAVFRWKGGESSALAYLQYYIWGRKALEQYVGTTDWSVSAKCDFSKEQTSKLSPYLAFGCVSPRLVHQEVKRYGRECGRCKGIQGLINSLLWRDFYRFIVHFAWGDRMFHLFGPMSCGSAPGGHREPTKWCCKHYNNIFGGADPRMWEWGKDRDKLARWTEGRTGYPFVDAGMLELKHSGVLHHLNREIVGWFYVKDLKLDWRMAAEWFESCLLDYDCVLNWGNWAYFILTQIPAREDDRPGGGPRYRLPAYSPFLQASIVLAWGQEHDPDANYVKRWLPTLSGLPAQLAREPWLLKGCSAGNDDEEDKEQLTLLLGKDVSSSGWACETCTLVNPAKTTTCRMCGEVREGFARIDVSDSDWACEACTLLNPATVRTCGACGNQRPYVENTGHDRKKSSKLGIYHDPVVPPWPDEGSYGSCAECGGYSPGAVGDGKFYCGSCWLHWARDFSTKGAEDPVPGPPNDVELGWALVPAGAMLLKADVTTLVEGTKKSRGYPDGTDVPTPEASPAGKGGRVSRWQRKEALALSAQK